MDRKLGGLIFASLLSGCATMAEKTPEQNAALARALICAAFPNNQCLAQARADQVQQRPSELVSHKLMAFGGQGHQQYLGCLNCNAMSSDSVDNSMGSYGSPMSMTSVRNKMGPYGSRMSGASACNPMATDPPVVVDEGGSYWGRLTVNSMADPIRDPAVADWLRGVCGS